MRTIQPGPRADEDGLEVRDEVPAPAPRPRLLERWGFPAGIRPVREALLVVVVVGPVLTVVYRLYDAHWKVPFSYSGDGLQTAAYTKALTDNSWYFHNPRLAAPFTADWRDFPLGGENLHWLALKILGLFTGNYAITENTYFVLGFFAIALVAFFVARYLQFGVASALVVGVLFAFLPFHAYRNLAHLTRGTYYTVPLGVLVLVWMTRYRRELLRDDGGTWRLRRGRCAVALGTGVLLATTDDQNAAFLISILAILAVVASLRDRDWRPVAIAGVLAVATFGTLLVNNTPFVVARLDRGANTDVVNRALDDQDNFGLRAVDLVVPAPGHRVPALRVLATDAARGQVTDSEAAGTALGLVGSVGLVFSVGAAFALVLGGRHRRRSTELAADLGVINLVAILVGAIGGLSFLIALFGFGLYRTWNRISVFIAYSALLAAAILLERAFRWLRARTTRRGLATATVALIAAGLIVGGAFDQTTPKFVPDYKQLAVRFDTDATFYHDVENMLPPSSMVFQLPVAPFPEAGYIDRMGDYSEIAAYLHTKTLRWSYGGIRGRPEGEWQANLSVYDPVALFAQVAAAGFRGVVVDRTGFADGGDTLVRAAEPYTGAPLVRSTDDRLLYLDLTRLRARLERDLGAGAVQQSADVVLGRTIAWNGFSYPEPVCTGERPGIRRWTTERDASVTLDNTTGRPVAVDASTLLEANPKAVRVRVSGPGFTDVVPLVKGNGRWQRSIVLPAGHSTIHFVLAGPTYDARNDARRLFVALRDADFGAPFGSPVVVWAHDRQPVCNQG